MDTIAQMSVPSTKSISIAASQLFLSPNCSGVNAKLKIKLKRNGIATANGSCFCHAKNNTFPNDSAINTYKNVHTGPKSHEGGAHEGFANCKYQLEGGI